MRDIQSQARLFKSYDNFIKQQGEEAHSGYSGKNQVIYSPDYGSKSPIKMYVVDS
jgi:hypothetical protein